MDVGYLGPTGTYTETAMRAAFPNDTAVAYPTIETVFAALGQGIVQRAVVPFENMVEGPVTETLDALYTWAERIHVVDMRLLNIEHALGALDPQATFTTVLSKDQALRQCSLYLQTHLSHVVQQETPSTAAAVQAVAQAGRTDALVIGAASTLRAYGFVLLAENIGNIPNNRTRFAVLAPPDVPYRATSGSFVTACVIHPMHDRVGLLHDILATVSGRHKVSCSSITSRPDSHGTFRFHLELERHLDTPAIAACLDDLRRTLADAATRLFVCGTYPKCEFYERRIRTIGIVGGEGRMGHWFRPFFEQADIQVLSCDKNTPLTHAACVAQSDVVLINVPLADTAEVIAQVAPLCRAGQLLVDNTSVKSEPVAAMGEAAPEGVEVLGMHTIFGPGIATLREQNVVFCRTPSCGPMAQELETIFYKYGAIITHTTPREHDKQMALHQNLEHFTKVVLAEFLRREFGNLDACTRYTSPNSRLSLGTMARMLLGDPNLYAGIQQHNREGAPLIEKFNQVMQQFGQAVAEGRIDVIASSLRQSRATFTEATLIRLLEGMYSPE